jgi:hypothetical protein
MRMHRDHLRFHLLQLLFRRPWVRVTLGPSSSRLRIKIDCRRRRWAPTLWSESLPPLTSPQLSPDPLRMEGRCDLPRWRLRGSNGQLKVSIAPTTNSTSLCIYFSGPVSFRFVSFCISSFRYILRLHHYCVSRPCVSICRSCSLCLFHHSLAGWRNRASCIIDSLMLFSHSLLHVGSVTYSSL